MASKSAYQSSEPGAEIEEMLDLLDTALDRLRVMYEQYFLGIAKVAPSYLHTDAERKLRECAQVQIRNTALRYRFATLQQKYGAYNNYWRRTVRQIENGTYIRSLSRVKRKAEAKGDNIPEEILAAMPKRMREQVARDRDLATAEASRRGKLIKDADLPGGADFRLPDLVLDDGDDVAEISSPLPPELGREHRVDTKEIAGDDLQQMLADMAAPDVARPPTAAIRSIEASRRKRDTEQGLPPLKPPTIPPATRAAPKPDALPAIPAPRPPAQTPERAGIRPEAPASPSRGERTSSPSVQAATLPALGAPVRPQRPPERAATVPGAPTPPRPQPPRPPVPPARAATNPGARAAAAAARPDPLPPGMTEADVRTLYQKYARARELVGERNDDSTYQALLRTLHKQAPKIMAEYNAKGVEFGVVIKDKQVVLKAKPKG